MTTSVRLNDVGTLIRVNCGSDISTATVRKIIYKKPDGTVGEWAATLADTTYLEYNAIVNDFDQTGLWKLQSYVELPSGKWYGDICTFNVEQSFQLSS